MGQCRGVEMEWKQLETVDDMEKDPRGTDGEENIYFLVTFGFIRQSTLIPFLCS